MSECGRRGWLDGEQEFDNPCVCDMTADHAGLHQCRVGCGEWAGGLPAAEIEAPNE